MVIKNVENRLAELELNGDNDSKENYVYVPALSKSMDTTISIDSTLQWEKELMADPKVRRYTF